MNAFSKAINSIRYQNATYLPSSSVGNPKPWMRNFASAGIQVDERSALTLSAYFDGVNLLANHIAGLPFSVIERNHATGNIEHISNHQLRELLHFQPNPRMSAFTFKKLMTVYMLNYGNAFAKIKKSGNKIVSLTPKKPWETTILQNKQSGEVFYKFKDDNKRYAQRDVLHLHQFSLDGIIGLSIIEAGARDRFSGHLAVEKFGEAYFKNGTHISGILKTKDSLGSEPKVVNKAKSQVREEFETIYSGTDNFHKLAILEGDWEYENVTIKATDAQLVERSKATVQDVARWLGIPVSKLKQTDGQANNSREAEAINYVQDALNPRIQIWAQETRNKLLLGSEKRKGYETYFDSKDLMRSDLKSLSEFLSKMVDRGIFTPNQALKFINADTFPEGDVHLMQENMKILEDHIAETTNTQN